MFILRLSVMVSCKTDNDKMLLFIIYLFKGIGNHTTQQGLYIDDNNMSLNDSKRTVIERGWITHLMMKTKRTDCIRQVLF